LTTTLYPNNPSADRECRTIKRNPPLGLIGRTGDGFAACRRKVATRCSSTRWRGGRIRRSHRHDGVRSRPRYSCKDIAEKTRLGVSRCAVAVTGQDPSREPYRETRDARTGQTGERAEANHQRTEASNLNPWRGGRRLPIRPSRTSLPPESQVDVDLGRRPPVGQMTTGQPGNLAVNSGGEASRHVGRTAPRRGRARLAGHKVLSTIQSRQVEKRQERAAVVLKRPGNGGPPSQRSTRRPMDRISAPQCPRSAGEEPV